MTAGDLTIMTLGHCRIDSPLKAAIELRKTTEHYVSESDRVLFHDTHEGVAASGFASGSSPAAASAPASTT